MGLHQGTEWKDGGSQRKGIGQPFSVQGEAFPEANLLPSAAVLAYPLLNDLYRAKEPFFPMLEHRCRLLDAAQFFRSRRLTRLPEDVTADIPLLLANPAA